MKVQFTETEVKIIQTCLDRWGAESQIGKAVEECAELIVALQKYVICKSGTVEDILDEIADVEMMLAQMRLVLGIDDDTLRRRIEYKMERVKQYLARDEA